MEISRPGLHRMMWVNTFCICINPHVHRALPIIHVSLNPFPNKSFILHVCSASLLKVLWEKEKLPVIGDFSFSHIVYLLHDFFQSSSNLKF